MLGGFNYKSKQQTLTTLHYITLHYTTLHYITLTSLFCLANPKTTLHRSSGLRTDVKLPAGQLDDIIVIICFQSVKY